MCEIYLGLMEQGQSMVQIDDMDIMFYFDILAYKKRKDELENTQSYDSAGL